MTRNWRSTAQCQHHPAALFDPVSQDELPSKRVVRVRVAGHICADCPSKTPCLIEGRAGKESGVWGGVLLNHGRRVPVPPIQGLTVAHVAPNTRPLSLVAS